jgi:hypothetical protein
MYIYAGFSRVASACAPLIYYTTNLLLILLQRQRGLQPRVLRRNCSFFFARIYLFLLPNLLPLLILLQSQRGLQPRVLCRRATNLLLAAEATLIYLWFYYRDREGFSRASSAEGDYISRKFTTPLIYYWFYYRDREGFSRASSAGGDFVSPTSCSRSPTFSFLRY